MVTWLERPGNNELKMSCIDLHQISLTMQFPGPNLNSVPTRSHLLVVMMILSLDRAM